MPPYEAMTLLRTESDDHGGKAPRRGASSYLPVLALAVLTLIWGYNWVVMKVGLRYSQPFAFASLRNVLSAVGLFVLLPLLRRPLRPKAFGMTLLVGLLQTTGFVGLIMWALETGGAGRVVVLTYTMPFWLLLMAWVVLGERLRTFQWLAVALAFAGLLLILDPWQLHGVASSLIAVGGGFSWAASAVAVKVLHRRHDVDLLSLTAWQMLLGSLPLILIAALTYTRPPVWSTSFIWALAFNVLFANALAWVLWLYVLRSMPTGNAGIGTLAIPVVGVVSAWLQLGERPGLGEAIGMAMVVAALCVITLRGVVLGRRAAAPLLAEPLPPPD
jgi:drug/metabolite transporter (DMT)-like permease